MFAVAGRRPQENLFLLNGIEYTGASVINDTPGGTSGQLLGVDAVREFNVVTDAYGAEYGKRPGAQITIVTAGGTNALHGSLYEFIRNSDLDARNFFDQGHIPQFQRATISRSAGRSDSKGQDVHLRQLRGLPPASRPERPDVSPRCERATRNHRQHQRRHYESLASPVGPLAPAKWTPTSAAASPRPSAIRCKPCAKISGGTTRLDHLFSDRDSIFGVYTIDDSAGYDAVRKSLERRGRKSS